jgi:membrane-associated phospholipid phosphatase
VNKKLLVYDAELTEKLQVAETSGVLRRMAILFAHSGDSWFWLVGLAGVYILGSEPWKTLALWLGISILLTAGVVLVIKLIFRRKRPEGDWGTIYRKTDPHSFPSGHAARAVLLATLAVGMGPAWLGIVLVIWAPFVILARVAMGVHYLSDVLAGALLGLAVGCFILIGLLPPNLF